MIVCLGTTPVFQRTMTFERLTLDEVNRAIQVDDYASGKSINVARVAQALGAQVLAVGFAGGARGAAIERDLDADRISHTFIPVGPQTRQCVTVIDRSAGAVTELVEESAPVGPDAWAKLAALLDRELPAAAVWIFSGTLTPDAPPDFYARWLPLAGRSGARAIIDARGEPLRLAMQHPNGILKLNRAELSATLGADLGHDDALRSAMRRHVPPGGSLIVTLGAAGALACEATGRCWRVSSPRVQALNTVGSGDAFAAGLGVALERGQAVAEALRLAAACGAANAITPRAGYVVPTDVERLLGKVEIEAL